MALAWLATTELDLKKKKKKAGAFGLEHQAGWPTGIRHRLPLLQQVWAICPKQSQWFSKRLLGQGLRELQADQKVAGGQAPSEGPVVWETHLAQGCCESSC